MDCASAQLAGHGQLAQVDREPVVELRAVLGQGLSDGLEFGSAVIAAANALMNRSRSVHKPGFHFRRRWALVSAHQPKLRNHHIIRMAKRDDLVILVGGGDTAIRGLLDTLPWA